MLPAAEWTNWQDGRVTAIKEPHELQGGDREAHAELATQGMEEAFQHLFAVGFSFDPTLRKYPYLSTAHPVSDGMRRQIWISQTVIGFEVANCNIKSALTRRRE